MPDSLDSRHTIQMVNNDRRIYGGNDGGISTVFLPYR